MRLSEQYPNFIIAMKESVSGTDTILVMDNNKCIGYIMSLVLFKNKVGNITIELEHFNPGVVLSFSTMKGIVEKAKTSSEVINHDLSVDQWREIISNTMVQHHYSQNHTNFLNSISQEIILKPKNSGCALFFVILISTVGFILTTI